MCHALIHERRYEQPVTVVMKPTSNEHCVSTQQGWYSPTSEPYLPRHRMMGLCRNPCLMMAWNEDCFQLVVFHPKRHRCDERNLFWSQWQECCVWRVVVLSLVGLLLADYERGEEYVRIAPKLNVAAANVHQLSKRKPYQLRSNCKTPLIIPSS